MKIMIDFDGVIHSFSSGYTGIIPNDPPVSGSKDFIEWLLDNDHEVVIFTSRAVPGSKDCLKSVVAIRDWLCKYGFPEVRLTGVKEPAELYIDDRGYRFTGHFGELRDWIRNNRVQPYHNREVY